MRPTFLTRIVLKNSELVAHSESYPFSLPSIKNLQEITFSPEVTFFVGENGTGKSTLLEAIAFHADFGIEGGNKNIHFQTDTTGAQTATEILADALTLSWMKRPRHGYFFRAESFFNFAHYIDYLAREGGGPEKAYAPYGGTSFNRQSHGEGFLSFFTNRLLMEDFFILDEPESSLSPQRQLALLKIIHTACKNYGAQCIIATHSPILLAYPQAKIYSFDGNALREISYEETEHYQITKNFLNNPDLYLRHLLDK